MTSRATAIAAIAAGLMLTAAGCSSGSSTPSAAPTPAPPSSTAATTPEPVAATTSAGGTPAQQAENAAQQAVITFWAKLDDLASNPNLKLSGLTTTARGQALTQWQRNLTASRGAGHRQVGSVVVTSATATKAKKATYKVTACVDVSKVNVVDQQGKSVLAAGRRPRSQYTYQVTKDGAGFYVTRDTLKASAC
jgi:hypothetical protein